MHDFRNNWTLPEVLALFETPFFELCLTAHTTHIAHFPNNEVQLSSLLSIKTGGCPEDCKYCPQSAHHQNKIPATPLLPLETVIEKAKEAKANGATRFCMGAAWRNPNDRDLPKVAAMINAVKELGLETCATLGMLNAEQAKILKEAGLDYYNHNIDSAPDFYPEIITTRSYEARLETIDNVRNADINVCCGGILGMGETRPDRAKFLIALANQSSHPDSVPINQLIPAENTPLAEIKKFDEIEFIRTVAIARIMMPRAYVRLSAGRENMSDSMQALCFFVGANSIFFGETLLTCKNPEQNKDLQLLNKLGLTVETLANAK